MLPAATAFASPCAPASSPAAEFLPSPSDSLLLAGLDLAAAPVITPEAFDGGTCDTIFVESVLPVADAPRQAPATVTVVDLEAAPGGDLGEVLDRVAGLQVRRYGGLGSESLPSIRGSSSSQVVVMVDGIPLSDARDGAVDLSTLPLDRYAAAEVYRGLAPTRFGGPGGAGAVNLVSRSDGAGASALEVSAGSFGEAGGRWSRGWGVSPRRSLMLMLHGRRADNRFAFTDHNQTFATDEDDSERDRVNAWFREWGASAVGSLQGGAWRLGGSAGWFRKDAGRPGPVGGWESPHASTRDIRTDARVTLDNSGAGLRCDVSGSRLDQQLYDADGEVGGAPPGTTRGVGDDLYLRAVWDARRDLGRTGSLGFSPGIDWRRQWYDQTDPGGGQPLRVRTTATAFATARIDLYGPRLSILPGLRWQWLDDDFPPLPVLPYLPPPAYDGPVRQDDPMPSIGVVWAAVGGLFFIDAHASRSVRPPNWTELFGDRRGVEGNPDLRPEEITTCDLALRWRPRGGPRLRVGGFLTRIDDTIVYTQSSWRTSKAFNFGEVRTVGLEAEAAGGLPGGGGWTLALTWQDAEDRGADPAYAGKDLPYLPPLQGSLSVHHPLGAGWRAGASLSHESANYRDRYNSGMERAGKRTLLGLSLDRTWRGLAAAGGRDATLGCELLNATDDDVYDVEGYPLPGRSLRVTLRIR